MSKPKIKITLVDRIGRCVCHHGHKIGDTFDYDTDRGKLAPWPCMLPFLVFHHGGTPPTSSNGKVSFCCPDTDVINVFRIEAG